jgi:hypothetical protein
VSKIAKNRLEHTLSKALFLVCLGETMKKITLLCLSLLSAHALLADVKLMMDVCVGADQCMKGEFVLDEVNPVAELSNPEANIIVQVQPVPADETTDEAPQFEVTINNNGAMSTHMVHGQWGCSMHCSNDMVMVTMMAQQ